MSWLGSKSGAQRCSETGCPCAFAGEESEMDGATWGSPLSHNDNGETLFQVPGVFHSCFAPDTSYCTEVPLGTNWSLRHLKILRIQPQDISGACRHSAMLDTLPGVSPTLVCSASFLVPPAPYVTSLTQSHSSSPSQEAQLELGTCSARSIHQGEFNREDTPPQL